MCGDLEGKYLPLRSKERMALPETLLSGLLEHLQTVSDPRQQTKVRYPLDEILLLSVSALISGCTEWQEVVDFGEDKLTWLRQYRPFENGIPSHDTVNRCISLIEPTAFEVMFVNWISEHLVPSPGTLINLDGKRLRSSATKLEQQTPRAEGGKSAIHLMQAWCSEFSLCLDIVQVNEKSNEISAIPLILNDLDVSGCVVSIDAIGCQKEVARNIIERRADYVLGLKQNQPALYSAVQETFFRAGKNALRYVETTTGHGRVEERRYAVLQANLLPSEALGEQWQALHSLLEVKTERLVTASAHMSKQTRYYISSLPTSPETLAAYVRGHWGIENKLHWSLDVMLGEDASRKRVRNAAANFGTILRIVLNLLKSDPEPISLKRKMKKAARSDDYRANLLKIAP